VYARLTLNTADPARLDEVISHHEQDVMPVLTHEGGYRGMSVAVNEELGVSVMWVYWATEQEMRANDATFTRPVHDAAYFGATVSIEHYEVARFVHSAPAHPGAAISLTRLEAEPTDDVLAAFGGIDMGSLATSDGFCTAVLLVDRQSGRAVIETIWRDVGALVAARSVAAARRLEAVSAGTVTVRGLEQYQLHLISVELE
jgi:hypothetical protein